MICGEFFHLRSAHENMSENIWVSWWWFPLYTGGCWNGNYHVITAALLCLTIGHCLLSIDNRTLAVDFVQLQDLCKLSLVSFNCHFVYFVMQLTVCSCPKLPVPIVFCPLPLSPCHCFLEAASYLIGLANSLLYVIMVSYWLEHKELVMWRKLFILLD